MEISIELSKQFHSYKYYTRALVDSMEELVKSHTSLDIGLLVSILCHEHEIL